MLLLLGRQARRYAPGQQAARERARPVAGAQVEVALARGQRPRQPAALQAPARQPQKLQALNRTLLTALP